MHEQTAEICLELRLDGDTLTGRATDKKGAVRYFSGRLGLMAAIDELAPGRSAKRAGGR